MTEAREDKRTIGVTPEGEACLRAIMTTGWFNEDIDVYRLAISVALVHGLIKSSSEMIGVGTKWSTAIDEGGKIRSLIIGLSEEPIARPYAYAEALAAAGLEYLKNHLVDQNAELSDILKAEEIKAPLWSNG